MKQMKQIKTIKELTELQPTIRNVVRRNDVILFIADTTWFAFQVVFHGGKHGQLGQVEIDIHQEGVVELGLTVQEAAKLGLIDTHTHRWHLLLESRLTNGRHIDYVSGANCECGVRLDQEEIMEMLNREE